MILTGARLQAHSSCRNPEYENVFRNSSSSTAEEASRSSVGPRESDKPPQRPPQPEGLTDFPCPITANVHQIERSFTNLPRIDRHD